MTTGYAGFLKAQAGLVQAVQVPETGYTGGIKDPHGRFHRL